MKTVTVNAENLEQILSALVGPGHLIRELQYTMQLPNNPIVALINEYNKQVGDFNAQAAFQKNRS